jgi:hypothetical protein
MIIRKIKSIFKNKHTFECKNYYRNTKRLYKIRLEKNNTIKKRLLFLGNCLTKNDLNYTKFILYNIALF